MKNGIEKILRKIGSLSKSNVVYLLESSKNGSVVLSLTGKTQIDPIKFSAFNKFINRKKKPTLTEVKKSSSFSGIKKSSDIKY